MAEKTPCSTQKNAWIAATSKFRQNELTIASLNRQIGSAITQIRTLRRPPEELAWAHEMAGLATAAAGKSRHHQKVALAFEMKGNVQASRLRRLAVKRGGAVEQREGLSSKQDAAEQAYRECLNRLTQALRGQSRCGQPRTGRGNEGEPCRRLLGSDAICPYHGVAIV